MYRNQTAQILYIGCVFVADEDADVSETEPDKGKQADIPAFFPFTFPIFLAALLFCVSFLISKVVF
jgi:hypothetical protein